MLFEDGPQLRAAFEDEAAAAGLTTPGEGFGCGLLGPSRREFEGDPRRSSGSVFCAVDRAQGARVVWTEQARLLLSSASGGPRLDLRLWAFFVDDPVLLGLLAAVPEAIVPTCRWLDDTSDDRPGQLDDVICEPTSGALQVHYQVYDSPESLQTMYDVWLDLAGVARDQGPGCAAGWPSERGWTALERPGQETGRMMCSTSSAGPTIIWTDTDQRILGLAIGVAAEGVDLQLLAFWRTAGPVLAGG